MHSAGREVGTSSLVYRSLGFMGVLCSGMLQNIWPFVVVLSVIQRDDEARRRKASALPHLSPANAERLFLRESFKQISRSKPHTA